MNSDTEWPAATVQYRLHLPRALHPISPALSALHASRATALHPEISAALRPSHCPKCGTYFFSGDRPSYLVGPSARKSRRSGTSSHPKALYRKCHLCGFSVKARTSPSLDHSSVPVQSPSDLPGIGTVPVVRRANNTGQELPPSDVSRAVETTQRAPDLPLPRQQSYPKPGRAKTSTLKDMLYRDHQREVMKSQKRRKEDREGLAAFLKEL